MISSEELNDILKTYESDYGFMLYARSGNPTVGVDSYNYIFIDDLGINITINPNNLNFEFSYIVDIFKLGCNMPMSPITNKEHFRRMYERFRSSVLKIKNMN